MTIKTTSLIIDKRISRSSFSWLSPSPKEDRRHSLTPSPTTSSTSSNNKKFGFFSKFKSSTTDLSLHHQGLTSDDDDEDEEDDENEKIPPTPRDSLTHPPQPPSSKPSIITHPHFLQKEQHTYPLLPSSPPPLPPQHATLYQSVCEILNNTFDDIDDIIEQEWESSRKQLEINLHTTPTYQFI
ncbi:hypothetical protein BJ944DRAFT_269507 [Cunninghamella echinulata]|nr:hypothetical protein BJ944DRAFT_269507 [Cunninghamella echinulata]